MDNRSHRDMSRCDKKNQLIIVNCTLSIIHCTLSINLAYSTTNNSKAELSPRHSVFTTKKAVKNRLFCYFGSIVPWCDATNCPLFIVHCSLSIVHCSLFIVNSLPPVYLLQNPLFLPECYMQHSANCLG